MCGSNGAWLFETALMHGSLEVKACGIQLHELHVFPSALFAHFALNRI